MIYEVVVLEKIELAGIEKKIERQKPPMSLWGEYYSHELSRSYVCDFEIFPDKNTEDVKAEIYISIE